MPWGSPGPQDRVTGVTEAPEGKARSRPGVSCQSLPAPEPGPGAETDRQGRKAAEARQVSPPARAPGARCEQLSGTGPTPPLVEPWPGCWAWRAARDSRASSGHGRGYAAQDVALPGAGTCESCGIFAP